MSETREFPTAVVASATSGILLCEFSKMHEFAEFVMGHPIWTHHFADKGLWRDMKRTILAQCPGMPTKLKGVTPENVFARIAELEVELGAAQTIRKGDGRTAMRPTDGIPDHVKVIQIEVGPKEGEQ